MLIKDLKKRIGDVIECAIVDGSKIRIKKVEVGKVPNSIVLTIIDKLGRKTSGHIYIPLRTWDDKPYFEYHTGYWNPKKVRLYPSKDDAYRSLIDKLRQQRQEINKKMMKIQMEVFGKRVENV